MSKKDQKKQELKNQNQKVVLDQMIDDSSSEKSDDSWVEISHKKKRGEAPNKSTNEIQKNSGKKDILTQEDVQKLDELDRSLKQRLALVLQQVDAQSKSNIQDNASKYSVKPSQPETKVAEAIASVPETTKQSTIDLEPIKTPTQMISQVKIPQISNDQSNFEDKLLDKPQNKTLKKETDSQQNNKPQLQKVSKEVVANNQQKEFKTLISNEVKQLIISSKVNKENPFFKSTLTCRENITGTQLFGKLKRYNRLSLGVGAYTSYGDEPVKDVPNKSKQQSQPASVQKQTIQLKEPVQEQASIQLKEQQKDNFNQSPVRRVGSPDLYDNQDLANSIGEVSQVDASLLQSESRKRQIRENIEVSIHSLDNGEKLISLETMLSIVDQSLELMKDQYAVYIKQMRGVRRQQLFNDKDYQLYLQTILQMTNDVFNILQEGYSMVCQALDIEEELFEHSYVQWANIEESDNQTTDTDDNECNQFVSRITFAQQELKENIKSRVNILKNKGKEVVKYQLELIKTHKYVDVFTEIMPFFQQSSDQQQLLPAVLSYVIEDLIYQKFNIEEEDKIKFLKTNRYDKELQNLLVELDEVAKEHFEVNLQQG